MADDDDRPQFAREVKVTPQDIAFGPILMEKMDEDGFGVVAGLYDNGAGDRGGYVECIHLEAVWEQFGAALVGLCLMMWLEGHATGYRRASQPVDALTDAEVEEAHAMIGTRLGAGVEVLDVSPCATCGWEFACEDGCHS